MSNHLKGRLQVASGSISIVELVSVWTRGTGSSQEGFKTSLECTRALSVVIDIQLNPSDSSRKTWQAKCLQKCFHCNPKNCTLTFEAKNLTIKPISYSKNWSKDSSSVHHYFIFFMTTKSIGQPKV